MIITFLQVLYFLGKYVYTNYNNRVKAVKYTKHEDETSKEIINNDASCSNFNKTPDEFTSNEDYQPTTGNIHFSPPAYIQRYVAVRDIISDSKYQGKIRKVVDFGCSELGFLTHLKNTGTIEEILCVDVDRNTLEANKWKIRPLTCDYLHCRKTPLSIKILEGSITDPDQVLINTDAVICIELIEHLHQDTLSNLPFNIFAFVKPQLVIITTPNADFNVLFGDMNGRFRHWDHKFEWTRKQFEDWANNIVKDYPDYEVTFDGICSGPEGSESLGKCSQMAVFTRKKIPDYRLPGVENLYKLIASEDYPLLIDNRPDEVKIFQEAIFYIRQYSINTDEEEMSLDILVNRIKDLNVTIETLKNVLENADMEIVNHLEKGLSVICPQLSTFSDYDSENLYDENDFDIDSIYQEDWEDEPGPPIDYQWPEIQDEDEENWAIEMPDIPYVTSRNGDDDSDDSDGDLSPRIHDEDDENSAIEMPVISCVSSRHDDNNLEESNNDLQNSSIDINIDGIDFRSLQSLDESKRPWDLGLESLEISAYISSDDLKHVTNDKHSIQEASNVINNQGNTEIIADLVSNKINETTNLNISGEISEECQCTRDLRSMCSMYLEPSNCDNSQLCPGDLTNSDFECSKLLDDSIGFSELGQQDNLNSDNGLLSPSHGVPKQTSTPHNKVDNRDKKVEQHLTITDEIIHTECDGKVQSEESSNDFYSCENSLRSDVDSRVDVFEFMERKKILLNLWLRDSGSSSRRSLLNEKSPKYPENSSMSVDSLDDFMFSMNSQSIFNSSNSSKDELSTLKFTLDKSEEMELSLDDKKIKCTNESKETLDEIQDLMKEESFEMTISSSKSHESPSSSWSPEIIDSGYPNTTSSAQDMTPENDLSSIADDESPSVNNPPQNFEHIQVNVQVENGDIANNNRDGEGNNVIAVNNDIIRDMENENNIYDFPGAEGALAQLRPILNLQVDQQIPRE